ncbi:MAG: putative zinc-binding protein [Bryobacteraceae bacterium]|nr:putative zinc-binding protein [Bryobacteraceae bacterium]
MAENKQCACNGGLKLVFSCSGAADTAEIADRAARGILRGGEARMYCLAGIGGDVDMIVNNTRAATRILVIDGCETDCAARLLRKAGFDGFDHLRVVDLGLAKGQSPATEEAVERIALAALALLRECEA